jgi:hypothetical protein
MFCPDCGAENSRGQKFCTRCGTNLIAIDRARDIISEMTTNTPLPQFESSTVLKIVALISIFGFLFVTTGTVALMLIDNGRGPIPVFFGLGGFISLVMLCRHLLKLVNPVAKVGANPASPPLVSAAPIARGSTNRALNEGATPYHSIIEDPTQQFEAERRSK